MTKKKGINGNIFLIVLAVILGSFFLKGMLNDSSSDSKVFDNQQADFVVKQGSQVIRIVSGSENKELEPILSEYADKANITIEMDYKGSLDIMRLLQSNNTDYDAVWPASSLWLNMGDTHHVLKHTESISTSPIGFGIKQSLAQELGFVSNSDVTIKDIIQHIRSGKLKFAMTSATQSNSGASAYLGFLTAIAGKSQDVLDMEDLKNNQVTEEIRTLLSGVNRSSGSSNWLVDLFVNGDYDAMVNYETLLIQTNQRLTKDGREPLYVVYPKDGLAMSDSPLAFISQEDEKKEQIFKELQAFLLSEETQKKIEKTGRRSAFGQVSDDNASVFKAEWGLDPKRVIAPITYPAPDTIMEALNLYQTQFKKPSITYYVLDYSGSMSGTGNLQLVQALQQVLVPENAQAHLLKGTSEDITIVVPFSSEVMNVYEAKGNGEEMRNLYDIVKNLETGGGTHLYQALDHTLELIKEKHANKLADYTPMIVILSDGKANDSSDEFIEKYKQEHMDIPIFSIMFGGAQEDELKALADLSNGRVFDGRINMIESFQTVKGYN